MLRTSAPAPDVVIKPWTLLLTEMISVLDCAGVPTLRLGLASDAAPQAFIRIVLLGPIEDEGFAWMVPTGWFSISMRCTLNGPLDPVAERSQLPLESCGTVL